MNLLLIKPSEITSQNEVVLVGRYHLHILKVLRAKTEDKIRIGCIDGNIGTARLRSIDDRQAVLADLIFETPPPAALPVTLILALPRPKMLKRVLQCATAMGVKEIHLINSYKVEKSFWSSPWLTDSKLQENSLLGLEQAQDTILPTIYQHKLFKPFVEDTLPSLSEGTEKFVAHPYTQATCPTELISSTTLAIGPEGGFIDYEINKLVEAGFKPIKLGNRILRVETAVPAILAKMFPFS